MNPNLKTSLALTFILVSGVVYSQVKSDTVPQRRFREYHRRFQISLFPGISTNGVFSGAYYNNFSLNLFGGLSAGTRHLEIGLITNSNLKKSSGIQLAGMANIIGANTFINLTLSEERALINNDVESNIKGIQFAGILNYVLDNATGIQITGGLNVNGYNFKGFQFAGIGNSAGGWSQSISIAGLYNVADDYEAGIQISTLFNYTGEDLSGTQIALINKSQRMQGRHSTPPTKARSLQIGLINFCKEMDGNQIGLINFGGAMRGRQIGLVNFFRVPGTKEQVRNGTPIGLLNFGSMGSNLRLQYNEIFSFNLEYTLGNCLNCTWTQSQMPYWDFNKIFNQNVLIIGYDYWKETWGFGWGFQKFLYNKSSMLPNDLKNERRIITYGVKLMHLNPKDHIDKTFNMVTRLNVDWGKRKPLKSRCWTVGVSLNYFMFETDKKDYQVQSINADTGKLLKWNTMIWPGYSAGIQF